MHLGIDFFRSVCYIVIRELIKMKYDKYGDPIIEKETKMNGKRRKAFAVTMVLQAIIIAINVAIMFIPSINGYLCFIFAPFYIFLFVTYVKAVATVKDDGISITKYQIFKFVSIALYIITAAMCMVINY